MSELLLLPGIARPQPSFGCVDTYFLHSVEYLQTFFLLSDSIDENLEKFATAAKNLHSRIETMDKTK